MAVVNIHESQLPPTTLTGVTKAMEIYDYEGLGPSVPLYIITDDDEAGLQANDSQYGLRSAIYM